MPAVLDPLDREVRDQLAGTAALDREKTARALDTVIEERIRLLENGTVMEVEYTMTDPTLWQGEWKSTKRFGRQDYTDINESNCILAYNANLPGTDLGRAEAEERGQSNVEGVPQDD